MCFYNRADSFYLFNILDDNISVRLKSLAPVFSQPQHHAVYISGYTRTSQILYICLCLEGDKLIDGQELIS